jgi:hypothetical protein
MCMVEVEMNQAQLIRSIEQQLDNLQSINQMSFDYWLSELCDENDELILEKCNAQVLSQLEQEVYDND